METYSYMYLCTTIYIYSFNLKYYAQWPCFLKDTSDVSIYGMESRRGPLCHVQYVHWSGHVYNPGQFMNKNLTIWKQISWSLKNKLSTSLHIIMIFVAFFTRCVFCMFLTEQYMTRWTTNVFISADLYLLFKWEKKFMFVKRHCKIFEIHYCALLLIDTRNRSKVMAF